MVKPVKPLTKKSLNDKIIVKNDRGARSAENYNKRGLRYADHRSKGAGKIFE